MVLKGLFKMPKATNISGRSSTITNVFVGAIIPLINPTEEEILNSLRILGIDKNNITCAYCGKQATEWDHLRPIVKNKRPTGYISNIYNLVPACGKCNQSKGGKYWKDWILSSAKLSPSSIGIKNLDKKISKLEEYEKWSNVVAIDYEKIVESKKWRQYWDKCESINRDLFEAQKLAKELNKEILIGLKSK